MKEEKKNADHAKDRSGLVWCINLLCIVGKCVSVH